MKQLTKTPPKDRAIESFRNSGISDVDAACEILDNSIDANATLVDIRVHAEASNTTKVVFVDNGNGMTSKQLLDAWHMGSDNESGYDSNSHGKYGLGLTAAAITKSSNVTIITLNNDKYSTLIWLPEYGFKVDHRESDTDEITIFQDYMDSMYLKSGSVIPEKVTGTVIMWDDLHIWDSKKSETIIKNFRQKIENTYIGNLTGRQLDINAKSMNELDFLPVSNVVRVFVNKHECIAKDLVFGPLHDGNAVLDYDSGIDGLEDMPGVRLVTTVLKNEYYDNIEFEKHDIRATEAAGLYLYRNGRYIAIGKVGSRQAHLSISQFNKLFRAVLFWPSEYDVSVGMTYIKSRIVLTEKNMATIKQLVDSAKTLSNSVSSGKTDINRKKLEKGDETINKAVADLKELGVIASDDNEPDNVIIVANMDSEDPVVTTPTPSTPKQERINTFRDKPVTFVPDSFGDDVTVFTTSETPELLTVWVNNNTAWYEESFAPDDNAGNPSSRAMLLSFIHAQADCIDELANGNSKKVAVHTIDMLKKKWFINMNHIINQANNTQDLIED